MDLTDINWGCPVDSVKGLRPHSHRRPGPAAVNAAVRTKDSRREAVGEAVVCSPPGINYGLSVSRIFQMGWFLGGIPGFWVLRGEGKRRIWQARRFERLFVRPP